MYSMHKKCLIAEDMILCEIDTSKMYNVHNKCYVRTNKMSLSMRKSDCVLAQNYTCAHA